MFILVAKPNNRTLYSSGGDGGGGTEYRVQMSKNYKIHDII